MDLDHGDKASVSSHSAALASLPEPWRSDLEAELQAIDDRRLDNSKIKGRPSLWILCWRAFNAIVRTLRNLPEPPDGPEEIYSMAVDLLRNWGVGKWWRGVRRQWIRAAIDKGRNEYYGNVSLVREVADTSSERAADVSPGLPPAAAPPPATEELPAAKPESQLPAVEQEIATNLAPPAQCPGSTATPHPQRSPKRGRSRDTKKAEAIYAVVKRITEETRSPIGAWQEHLQRICKELDEVQITCPPKWTSWSHQRETELVVKNITYYLNIHRTLQHLKPSA